MSFNLIIEVMLPLAILVAAGGLWPAVSGISVKALRTQLNNLALYVFVPALMFSIAASTRIDTALLTVPLLVAGGILITGTLLYVLLYHSPLGRGLPNRTRAALLLSGMFGNVFYLGYPILVFLHGTPAGKYPAFADMMASTPLLWTVGVWIATSLGAQEKQAHESPWRVMRRLPPVWAFLLGTALNQSGLGWQPLIHAAALIGQATIPLMMFVIGLSIPWKTLRPGRALLTVVGVKLCVMPALIWALVWLFFGPLAEESRAAVIVSAMPTMLMAVLIADRFHLDTAAAALMIGWSTLLFWFTLPLWLALLV
ncbi:MAG: AEC family transporter [Pseudomonadota bacterium]